MATLEQMPEQDLRQQDDSTSVLDSALARVYTLNWEAIFYLAIFVLAVFTRFVNLGDRVMSHDESLHTKYSHDLYSRGVFQHTPLMHGPILFHMTALSYFLFGDSDFSARLYPAILGIIMVLMPKLLFERWLGKFGAMVTSVLILISPMLLYHHRYIRHDTPAIFFSLLMIYAIFAYLDGERPRQTRHLVLFAAAMILNLGSKETAFIYILIFSAFIVLYLLFQMLQGWQRGGLSRVVGWAVLGVLAVPLLGALATLIVAFLFEQFNVQLPEMLDLGIFQVPHDLLLMGLTIGLAVPLALILGGLGLFVYRIVWGGIGGLVQDVLGIISARGHSLYRITLAGLILGVVAALMMTNILSLIPPESISRASETWANWEAQQGTAQPGVLIPEPVELHPNVLLGRLVLWTAAVIVLLAAVVLGTALRRFIRLPRLPWFDIGLIAALAVVVCLVLIIFEERSRLVPNVSSEVRKITEFNNLWIYGTWVIGILAVAGIAVLRFQTRFWHEMRRFPAFDLVILIGSLILPWVAALPIFLAGYQLDGGYTDVRLINASIMGIIPFIAVAAAAGLAWQPGLWLVCAATFWGIFAFFFTTVFTNATGVATGVIGSLGYWLAQQGVRRGSQPQYYYMLIQVPIYEFLPLIGAALAGAAGMAGLWRFRAARYAAKIEEQGADPAADPEENGDGYAVSAARTQLSAVHTTAMQKQPQTTTDEYIDLDQAADQPDALSKAKRDHIPAEEAVEQPDALPKAKRGHIPAEEIVMRPLFIPFVGFWAVLILMALTLSGEKMPWLTTHITAPLCLLTGWYLGHLLEKIDWSAFWRQSWALLFLIPIAIVGAANIVGPFLLRGSPFGGLTREQQLQTFTWMGAIALTGVVAYAIYRIWRRVGTAQLIRISLLGAFVLLGILTARVAWMASYINYDYATEFLVYAHAAPANKTVMNYIEEISRRTTDGLNIKVAYDNLVSWPGSWYFRNYPQARFLGDTTGATGLDEYVAIVVGDANTHKIEGQLGDNFYKFEFIRLWWPMQEYFNLNVRRIDDALGDAEMRQALWDIWWNRDYRRYTAAYQRMTGDPNTRFEVDRWPVADRMAFYVRKDVAAQLWDFGIGAARVAGLPEDPFKNLRCDTCAAQMAFSNEIPLTNPRGLAVGPEGNIYVVDTQNNRVVVYDADGNYRRQFGTMSLLSEANATPPPGTFREPWGIAVGPDGTIYVADTWNHRIQVFSNEGTPLRAWGAFERSDPSVPGSAIGFYGPRDIAVDAQNRLFVADTGNKRVRVYDSEGAHLYDFGTQGALPGQMSEPVGLAINDRTNEIFVANTWNKRIDVYTLEGDFLRSWTLQGWYATTTTTDSGNRPYLALDHTGTYLFVTDPDAGRVLVFDTNGAPVLTFGRLGSVPLTLNQFGALGGIAMNDQGYLYLADAGGGRVLRFGPGTFPGLIPPLPEIILPSPTPVSETETPTLEDF